jgi:hypothetical protein
MLPPAHLLPHSPSCSSREGLYWQPVLTLPNLWAGVPQPPSVTILLRTTCKVDSTSSPPSHTQLFCRGGLYWPPVLTLPNLLEGLPQPPSLTNMLGATCKVASTSSPPSTLTQLFCKGGLCWQTVLSELRAGLPPSLLSFPLT